MKINELRVATLGGTLYSIWASVSFGEIIQTILMATCVGDGGKGDF